MTRSPYAVDVPSAAPGPPSGPRVWVTGGVCLLIVFGLVLHRGGLEFDTWWHAAVGRWMVDHGAILRTDPFSFTAHGVEWVRPGLLSDVGMYLLLRGGGMPLVNLAMASVLTSAWVMVWKRLPGSPLIRAGVLLWAVVVAAASAVPRPHVFTLLFVVVFDLICERERRQPSWWMWTLPGFMVLWVNLHGGFVLGFVVLACRLLPELRRGRPTDHGRRLLTALAACVPAVLVNPFGARILRYPFETLRLDALGQIVEWRPFDLANPADWPFLLLVVAVAVAALPRSPDRTRNVLIAAVFAALGFTALRHQAIFAVIAAPILATALARRLDAPAAPRRTPPLPFDLGLLAAACLAVVVLGWEGLTPQGNARAVEERYPVEAVAALAEAEFGPRLLNDYGWGGYVIWHLGPRYLVAIDGRTDLYGNDRFGGHVDLVSAAPGWEDELADLDPDVVLLRADEPLVEELGDLGWTMFARDDEAVVLVPPDHGRCQMCRSAP